MWKLKFGKCIYVSPSGFKVYQNFFYRWLTLGSDAFQTVINRRKPHIPGLRYLSCLTLLARQFPGTSCLLGLGGAGAAQMLQYQDQSSSLVAVDSSGEVIQIAQQFFMIEDLTNLTIRHQNAVEFIRTSSAHYSHIMIDLYGANHFPAECFNQEFFMNCYERLNQEGFLAINLANINEQWPIYQLVKEYFKTTLVIIVKKCNNMVIICAKNEARESFLSKIMDNKEIKKIVWMETWGFVGEY